MKELSAFDRYLLVMVLGLLVASAAYFVARALPAVDFAFQLDPVESLVFDQARRVHVADGLYPTLEKEPFVVDRYPPLYAFVMRTLGTVDGKPFAAGRVLSMVATLLSAAALGVLVRRSSRGALGWLAALLAPAVFLSFPEVDQLGVIARPEAFALACGSWGLVGLLSDRKWARWLGGGGLLLSLLSVHTFWAFPVVGIYAAHRRLGSWRFTGAAVGIILVAWGLVLGFSGERTFAHLFSLFFASYEQLRVGRYWGVPMGLTQLFLLMTAVITLLIVSSEGKGRRLAIACAVVFVAIGGALELRVQWAMSEVKALEEQIESKQEEIRSHLAAIEKATKENDQSGMRFVPLVKKAQDELVELENRVIAEASTGIPTQRYLILLSIVAMSLVALILNGFRLLGLPTDRERVLGDDSRSLLLLFGGFGALVLSFEGSDVGTRLEFMGVLAVVTTAAMSGWSTVPRTLVTVVLLGLSAAHLAGLGGGLANPERRDQIANSSAQLQARLATFDGPILSVDPQVGPLIGQPVRYHPFLSVAHDSALWDAAPLIAAINRKQYHAVVLVRGARGEDPFQYIHGLQFPESVLQAILNNYEPIRGSGVTMEEGSLIKRWEILRKR